MNGRNYNYLQMLCSKCYLKKKNWVPICSRFRYTNRAFISVLNNENPSNYDKVMYKEDSMLGHVSARNKVKLSVFLFGIFFKYAKCIYFSSMSIWFCIYMIDLKKSFLSSSLSQFLQKLPLKKILWFVAPPINTKCRNLSRIIKIYFVFYYTSKFHRILQLR